MVISKSLVMVQVMLLTIAGCTIAELKRDVNDREKRVGQKVEEVRGEEGRQTALLQDKETLLTDLKDRQMSLDDLTRRLTQLQAENQRAAETTAEQRERKQRLDGQLKKYKAQIAQLQQSKDVTNKDVPNAEKERKIEYLKAEIAKQLELLRY